MSATAALLNAIKTTLRARQITHRQFAKSLGVSEATVKRDLSRGKFSPQRLDRICDALDISLLELTQSPAERRLITQLSEVQEVALVEHPKVLLVTYLLLNDWKFAEIISAFQMDENELINILLRLDRLKIIDYRPP